MQSILEAMSYAVTGRVVVQHIYLHKVKTAIEFCTYSQNPPAQNTANMELAAVSNHLEGQTTN